MNAEALLQEISSYCRKTGMAESTFGRRAVNDGKLVSRLRFGGRITTETAERVRSFIRGESPPVAPSAKPANGRPPAEPLALPITPGMAPMPLPRGPDNPVKNFRFYDNRQKYLLFVNTCSEKWVIAERVAMELHNIHPRPPAIRVFDAGVGDGTVLVRVMRLMHGRFPHMPFYIAGKELSLEDVRLVLEKVADRMFEHPATVFVLTNMYYAEAPWLTPKSPAAAAGRR